MKLAELSELMSSERKGSQLQVAEYEDYIARKKDELDSIKSKCKWNNGVECSLGFQCWRSKKKVRMATSSSVARF